MSSGIARARYELDIVPLWQRSPKFYLDQTIGSVRVMFMKRPPVESARAVERPASQVRKRCAHGGLATHLPVRCGDVAALTRSEVKRRRGIPL